MPHECVQAWRVVVSPAGSGGMAMPWPSLIPITSFTPISPFHLAPGTSNHPPLPLAPSPSCVPMLPIPPFPLPPPPITHPTPSTTPEVDRHLTSKTFPCATTDIHHSSHHHPFSLPPPPPQKNNKQTAPSRPPTATTADLILVLPPSHYNTLSTRYASKQLSAYLNCDVPLTCPGSNLRDPLLRHHSRDRPLARTPLSTTRSRKCSTFSASNQVLAPRSWMYLPLSRQG